MARHLDFILSEMATRWRFPVEEKHDLVCFLKGHWILSDEWVIGPRHRSSDSFTLIQAKDNGSLAYRSSDCSEKEMNFGYIWL